MVLDQPITLSGGTCCTAKLILDTYPDQTLNVLLFKSSNSVLSATVQKYGLGLVGGGKQVYYTKELGCAECHVTSISRSRYNTKKSI